MSAFCETCRTLTNALSDAASRLGAAVINMHNASGKGELELFDAAMLEAQRIRKECQAIKAELVRHRADQHPTKVEQGSPSAMGT